MSEQTKNKFNIYNIYSIFYNMYRYLSSDRSLGEEVVLLAQDPDQGDVKIKIEIRKLYFSLFSINSFGRIGNSPSLHSRIKSPSFLINWGEIIAAGFCAHQRLLTAARFLKFYLIYFQISN